MLNKEQKKEYQRNYMKAKRSNIKGAPPPVRPEEMLDPDVRPKYSREDLDRASKLAIEDMVETCWGKDMTPYKCLDRPYIIPINRIDDGHPAIAHALTDPVKRAKLRHIIEAHEKNRGLLKMTTYGGLTLEAIAELLEVT